jgi:acyl dehydratase
MKTFVFSELDVGQDAQFSHVFSQEHLENFISLSGDISPIHVNVEKARERGFKHEVVHGMMVASLYSRLVGVHLPGENALLLGSKLSFHLPVYVGDALFVKGIVKNKHDAFQVIDISARINNEAGELVSKAVLNVKCHG